MASTMPNYESSEAPHDSSGNQPSYAFPLFALTSLFFMWGFITCLNDILIPYLKGAFDLSYTQAMLVQFCFFGAYFVVSVPAGFLVSKIGYKKGIVTGLVIAALGCLLFYPAAQMHVYAVFLFALFVLASGITILQVAANPYVTVLGKAKTASSRLTMTQAFNALGTTVAPFFGAFLLFGATHNPEVEAAAAGSDLVQLPYLILAGALLLLAATFTFLKLPDLGRKEENSTHVADAWKHRHLRFGVIGIFLYVGAEVAIGSFLVSFLSQASIAGLNEMQASKVIAFYWGGAMVGRFIGAAVMQKIAAGNVLAFNAVMVMLLVLSAIVFDGKLAMWSLLSVGLFNSIMFPTIFSLALNGLGQSTAQASGYLCLAIVGGALVPLLQGFFADKIGLQISFIVPLLCYFFIAYYGLKGSTPLKD
ncbi:sugar MFS transporter [Glaciecola sp. MH2013]|uniref:sugar MFS transporter n=1 Tax=Glaciecola sp. MH2013 TaxID=2785524 RepID=UPI0018A04B75|nr:sugar MFS transporter [Glaciecola sp. MH2013]MBF7074230.1 sugar MFS transporter [Glaciecola sp. MH2013]